jgi:ferredoxin
VSTRAIARAAGNLSVDWTACDGRGLCAELLPELIDRDDWGFPLITSDAVPATLMAHAKRAVTACPMLALRLETAQPT